jgi:ribosomal protein L24
LEAFGVTYALSETGFMSFDPKGDLVQVIAGADKGKQGRVLAVDTARGRVRVEKIRMHKRHLKPGRKGARTGGIVEQEADPCLERDAVDPD